MLFSNYLSQLAVGELPETNQPRWAYLHHGNQQMLQFRVFYFPFGRACR